ncbi:uncharacterized protein BCR38DRAFT_423313 [Pseudomassariella vexata]|uniref:Celp0028 effector like protein n=1 Tax=Pseudomassariella vexata TaxID=1141098 RepID=A0A1Y2EAN9_9PEZI|nr:uncharacterized protein BCR38DRAFT_423313 [Pseudomassariella vexata]ORY68457.1 hypothetical protein BCR38DRAFT_423313 [Pseudomassariella vexata]
MQLTHLTGFLAAVGVAVALPSPAAPLSFDDVVLINADGSSNVIKESEYNSLIARGILESPAAAAAAPAPAKKERRACASSAETQVTSDTSFINWDVAMSPVVSAAGGGVSVGVTSGYSIANSLSVSETVGASIESVLSVSLSLSYTETWTTSESTSLTYTVPDGQYGLIVSQPKVRRIEGNYLSGCTDSPSSEAFVSDTYTSQSYGNLQWVTGVIRLCNSTEYPVPFCVGTGSHS